MPGRLNLLDYFKMASTAVKTIEAQAPATADRLPAWLRNSTHFYDGCEAAWKAGVEACKRGDPDPNEILKRDRVKGHERVYDMLPLETKTIFDPRPEDKKRIVAVFCMAYLTEKSGQAFKGAAASGGTP